MCTCIEQMNEKLKGRNFEVDATIGWGNSPPKVRGRTVWIEKPKRAMTNPPAIIFLYCPMCGERYEDKEAV